MKRLKAYLKDFFNGQMAEKESLPEPSFTTTFPEQQPSLDQWLREFVIRPFKNHIQKDHAIQLQVLPRTGKP